MSLVEYSLSDDSEEEEEEALMEEDEAEGGRGPAVGTWRSDLLWQKWSDPRNAASQDVGRAVRPDRAP